MVAWSVLEPSAISQRAVNRLELVSQRKCKAPPGKSQLKLSIGDPTYDGNLTAPRSAVDAVVRCVEENKYNGNPPAAGWPEARQAVVEYWGKNFAGEHAVHLNGENVILTCGVSDALIMTATALCDEGDNILLPMPCFPYYDFKCDLYQIEGRSYRCNGDDNWEIDFDHLRSLVDDRTKAILMTNPSNPCGSNFSREHIADLIRLCEEFHLPLIADEIYAGLVFSGETFTSVASFDTPVPRLILGGISKNYMVPGWRLGWVILMDRDGHAKGLMKGMKNISNLIGGPCTLVQGALPKILLETPESYFTRNCEELRDNAMMFAKSVQKCNGLSCLVPQGAMYVMVKVNTDKFKDINSDWEFYEMLEDEENVQVVPGELFHMPGYIRVVVSRPKKICDEVVTRIHAFCERHKK